MERELTQEELDQITAGYPVNSGVVVEDELDLDALDNVKAGMANRELATQEAMKHPDLYREKAVDQLVEDMIRAEEQAAAMENVSQGMHR